MCAPVKFKWQEIIVQLCSFSYHSFLLWTTTLDRLDSTLSQDPEKRSDHDKRWDANAESYSKPDLGFRL
jgi:hypothetical protein